MKNLLLIFCLLVPLSLCAEKKYPSLYVSDADHEAVCNKIETQDWAKTSFQKIRDKVDMHVDRHVADPEWIISRLAMYWKEGERYTQCYLKDQNWDRGEGNAPVPTVRMPGMRTWNNYFNVPLEERTPYNESGDMWGYENRNKIKTLAYDTDEVLIYIGVYISCCLGSRSSRIHSTVS